MQIEFKTDRLHFHELKPEFVAADELGGAMRYSHAQLGTQKMVLESEAMCAVREARSEERRKIVGRIRAEAVMADTWHSHLGGHLRAIADQIAEG